MAVPRFYTPLSRLILYALVFSLAAITIGLGAAKVSGGMGWIEPGPASELVPPDVLLGLGLAELLLSVLLIWTRTSFFAALLLVGDYANHVLALVVVDRPIHAALLVAAVNLLSIVLWAWRPRFLGGDPRRVEIAFVD